MFLLHTTDNYRPLNPQQLATPWLSAAGLDNRGSARPAEAPGAAGSADTAVAAGRTSAAVARVGPGGCSGATVTAGAAGAPDSAQPAVTAGASVAGDRFEDFSWVSTGRE